MDSLTFNSAGAAHARLQHSPGNLVWDAGFESWKCELHRYSDQEILLDRCARGGDRLRIEAVRATEERFSVAYTICAPDSELPKCLSLVSGDLLYWGQATDCAANLAAAFVRRSQTDPRHAVLGHWNAWHVIDNAAELHAWRWDGESVFDLKRQFVLLDDFPEKLRQYAPSVPRSMRVEAEFRVPDQAMRDRYLMDVVAVDRHGYALIETRWFGDSACGHPPGYTVLPVHAAQDLVTKYRRSWFRAHATQYPEGPLCRRPKADAANGACA